MSAKRRSEPRAGPPWPGAAISVAPILLIGAGIVLRCWQYLSNNSLWLDEAALARNIVDRTPRELLGPLDYAQVAPVGFLLIEKTAVGLLGNSEWALRLFPLLCGILSLLVFWRFAARALQGWWAVYALGLFSLATPLVYFSSQVKQYSSDVAATVVLLAAALWLRNGSKDHEPGRAATVAALGAVVAWISQPALFVLAGGGAALAWCSWRDRRPAVRSTLLVCSVWAVSAGLSAGLAVRSVSASDRAYLDWFWSNGLMPFPPSSFSDFFWVWDRLTWLFGAFITGLRRSNGGLGYPWSQVFVVLALVGYYALWRRRRDAALILLLPVVFAVAAAGLHVYPFTGRVVTFLIPPLLIATAAGSAHALDILPRRLEFAAPVLLAIIVGAPVYATLTALPPERTEHLRPIVAAVAEHRRPGDVVYVYYGAGQPFEYYAPRFRFSSSDYLIGRCSVSDLRGYLRDLDRFRGRPRVWIVATHARLNAIELKTIVGYLDAIGRKALQFDERATSGFASNAAYGYLYDLSDDTLLARASAETYAVPSVAMDGAFSRWGCYGTQSTSTGL